MFDTHNSAQKHATRSKKKKMTRQDAGGTGCTPGHVLGGFWGHLKYYINRRDCVRRELTSELQNFTFCTENPPFLHTKMAQKFGFFGLKMSFSASSFKLSCVVLRVFLKKINF